MKQDRHVVMIVAALPSLALALPAIPASAGQHVSDGTRPSVSSAYVDFKAGYTATTSPDELTTASAKFVIPELSCTDSTEAVSIGIGREKRFGTFRYLAVLRITCDRFPRYALNAHVHGRRAHLTSGYVLEGHTVRVSVSRAESGAVTAIAKDLTSDVQVRQTGTPRNQDDAIDVGAFPLFLYGDLLPVPEFEPVLITEAKVGTDSGSQCIGERDPVTNVRKDRETGDVEIAPSPLEGCEFSLEFKSH